MRPRFFLFETVEAEPLRLPPRPGDPRELDPDGLSGHALKEVPCGRFFLSRARPSMLTMVSHLLHAEQRYGIIGARLEQHHTTVRIFA